MTQIQLYWNIISQPARAVKTLFDIGKIPCALHSIDLIKGQQRKKEYLQVNPFGKVPAIKDGDFALGQSGAIMAYLCEKYPQIAKYHGQTIEQRAVVNQYVSWYQNYFRPFLVSPVRLYLQAIIAKKPIYQHQKQTLIKGMFDAVKLLNEILAKNRTKFIAGDKPTMIDLLVYYEMTNLVYLGLDHQSYSEVKRWFSQVYRIQEVKAVTHEWYQTAKMLIQLFTTVQVIAKPKL